MTHRIYLEVSKENGAIMGATHYPRENSANFDFVPVTQEEFDYLNMLEDNVLPAGVITTLSDLIDYRKLKAEAAAKMATKAPAKSVAKAAKAPATTAPASKKNPTERKPLTKTEFMKGFTKPLKTK